MSPYGRARSPAVRATLDYPRRLNRDATRPMKASGLKDVSTCTAAMSRWACATLDCMQWCIVFNVRVCLIVFFVQLRLCNQRLLRSLRLRSVHNGGHRQLQNAKLVVCRFSLRNGLTPPVQSKIASLISLALNSQRRRGTVSPCPPKLCFAVMGSHTLWNVSVRKVHTSALLLLTPVLLLF